ncbi:MAG: hypothetical protein K1X79_09530 [Oligoflexia bacterium]|nr:hypothetical protein [Oligoflexia bacterium]
MRTRDHIVSCALLALSLSACSGAHSLEWKPDQKRHAYAVSLSQTAPEPVYNRLRWVHAPDVMPARDLADSGAGVIFPVVHLDLKAVSLDEAAKALASTSHYSSFCASSIAGRKLTISKLGTIDELAVAIGKSADIRVQVDHEGRAVRFLPKPAPEPAFYGTAPGASAAAPASQGLALVEKEVTPHEHQSTH